MSGHRRRNGVRIAKASLIIGVFAFAVAALLVQRHLVEILAYTFMCVCFGVWLACIGIMDGEGPE